MGLLGWGNDFGRTEQIIIAGNLVAQNKEMPRLVFREVAERRWLFELALSLDSQKFRENISDVMTFKICFTNGWDYIYMLLVRGGKSEPSLDQPKANQRDENSTI